jgi:RNA polymerase primary sigma factor
LGALCQPRSGRHKKKTKIKRPLKKAASSKKAAKPAKKLKKTIAPIKKVAKKKVVSKRTAPKKKAAAKPKAPKPKKLTKSEQAQESKALALLVLGRGRGYVTYDEILKEFPEIEKDVAFLEDLYERLATASIDIIGSGGMLGDDQSEELLDKRSQYRRNDSGYDSIQMYLREIGQYPLLTAKEERELAKRIVDGDTEARNLLARANLRLVVSIAKKICR